MRRQSCGEWQYEVLRQRTRPDKNLRCQPRCCLRHAFFACLIIIKGEQYSASLANCLYNEALLGFGQNAAHKGDDIPSPPLPELEDGKEALDDNETFRGILRGAVEVEDDK